MRQRGIRGLQLADDLLCQHLAQLYAPLVEGVDIPDHPLHIDTVLIERHQFAQRGRRQPLRQDRRGRPVAQEGLVRDQPFRHPLGAHFGGRLAKGQASPWAKILAINRS